MSSVAAVIVAWNRRPELRRALNSLLAQELPGDVRCRILILDDGSTDGTNEELALYTAADSRVLGFRSRENHGPAIGRNILLNMVKEEFVFFLDSDAWLQSVDALKRFLAFLHSNPSHIAVGGTIWSDENHEQPPFMIGGYLTEMLHADLPRWRSESDEPHFLSSCCSLWRTKPIVDAHGFDPFYGHGIEDVDLFVRLARQEGLLHVIPDIYAIHQMSDSGRRRPWREFQPVFQYLEWTRPYLRLKLYGWWGGVRKMVGETMMHSEFQTDYGMPVSLSNRLLGLYIYPAIHIALWPIYGTRGRRNHIDDARKYLSTLESITTP